MLGFAPLAAAPLAATLFAITPIVTEIGGETSLSFGVTGGAGAFYLTGGAGSLTLTPTASLFVNANTGGASSLVFTPTADLRLAGNPINFDMVTMPLHFNASGPLEFSGMAGQLVFQGVKQ